MNIALIGYGKMGKTLERMGKERGHAFPLIIDLDNAADLNERKVKTIDVAIEFTQPEAAPANIKRCIDLGVPVVCGTTGWNDQVEEVEIYCLEKKGSMFHASNYSIGVNILFAMNQKLAAMMNAFPQYRASMREIHHTAKKDAPSGTAISLAEQIIVENQHINKWKLGKEAEEGILPIEAYRQGEVKGVHMVYYESDMDLLTLGHEAKTRDAFAQGALLAAEFLPGKNGVFGMKDLLTL